MNSIGVAFFAEMAIVGRVMHGTRFFLLPSAPLAMTHTIAVSSGWLQVAALTATLAACLSVFGASCTPVGAINRSAQAAAGSSADPDLDIGDTSESFADAGLPPAAMSGGRRASASSAAGRGGARAPAQGGSRAQGGAGARAEAGHGAVQTGSGAGRSGSAGAAGAGGKVPTGSGGAASGEAGAAGAAGNARAGAGGDENQGGSSGSEGGAVSPTPTAWFCTQADASCTCVQVGDLEADSCAQPKPTCCFELVRFGSNACTCWPDDSAECKNQMVDVPDAKRTTTCPPSE